MVNPQASNYFHQLPVVLFGMGISNRSALKLLVRELAQVTAVNQGPPAKWSDWPLISSLISEQQCLSEENTDVVVNALSNCELVVLSPGIPTDHPLLVQAEALRKVKGRGPLTFWCEIELAYRFCSHIPIVAITGTNGKTTTTMLMGDLLKHAGKQVFVGGNIGTPLCELVLSQKNPDYIVLELSSFQLELMDQFHAHVGLFLNISPTHGERYRDIMNYFEAKTHLIDNMNQKDLLIYPQDQSLIDNWAQTIKHCQQVGLPVNHATDLKQWVQTVGIKLEGFKLIGHHNLVNLSFCLKAFEFLGLPMKLAQPGIDQFKAPDFRLQRLELSKCPFEVINDGKSTNWDSTITALKAIEGEQRCLVLLGGKSRKNVEEIPVEVIEWLRQKAFHVAFFGEVGAQLHQDFLNKNQIKSQRKLDSTCYSSLSSCLKQAVMILTSTVSEVHGPVLLFSPAYPSFDEFQNYQARGKFFDQFFTQYL